MTFSVWLAFAAASAVMGLIPGPGVAAIVGYALGSGRKTALASVAGMTAGNAIAMTLSLVGVGALLAASALAFSALKWVGALYLIVLGLYTFFKTSRATSAELKIDAISPRTAFLGNVAVSWECRRRRPSPQDHHLLRILRAPVHRCERQLCVASGGANGDILLNRGRHRRRLRTGGFRSTIIALSALMLRSGRSASVAAFLSPQEWRRRRPRRENISSVMRSRARRRRAEPRCMLNARRRRRARQSQEHSAAVLHAFAKRHHLVGHRRLLDCVGVSPLDLAGVSSMTTASPRSLPRYEKRASRPACSRPTTPPRSKSSPTHSYN